MTIYAPYFNYICGELLYGTRLSTSVYERHRDIWGGRRERSSGATSKHTDHGNYIIPSSSGSSTRHLTAFSFRQFSGDHLGLTDAYIEPSLSSQLKSPQRLDRVRRQNYCTHDAILTDRYNTHSISAHSGHQQDEFTPKQAYNSSSYAGR